MLGDRLPIVLPAVAVASQPDLVHLAQDARGDDLAHVHKVGVKATVVPDIELACGLGGGSLELQRFGNGKKRPKSLLRAKFL